MFTNYLEEECIKHKYGKRFDDDSANFELFVHILVHKNRPWEFF